MSRRNRSILSKLMWVIMLTVSMTLALLGVVLSANEWLRFRAMGVRSTSTLAEVVGTNSIAALAFRDQKVATEILGALKSEPEVILGCLYEKTGGSLAVYGPKDSATTCPPSPPPPGHAFVDGKLAVSSPVMQGSENLGTVYLLSDQRYLFRQLEIYVLLLAAVILGAGVFAFALASRLQPLVIRPITKLAETARTISEKSQFTVRATPSTEREINDLVSSFNRMLDAIQEREQERDNLLVRERAAREEAEKSITVRDDFISIASHELRTPLTPLTIHMQMMKRKLQEVQLSTDSEALLSSIDTACRQLKRLEKLIENLLDVSRITAGRLTLHREAVKLGDLVRETLERFTPEIARARCEVSLEIQADVEGHWDPLRIEQIATNLISNALKYGAGKPVQVIVSQADGNATLVVRDHGIGIAKADHPKIFGRFERVAPIQHYQGLGLGLFIARELTSAHGGSICVESEPNQGSVFTVQLPLDQMSDTSRA